MANLDRALGFRDSVALVVGTIIGSGIFLKSATMTQLLGSPVFVLAAWVVAGLLSLAGALIYAEIGARFPHAGGEYVYLREAYGTFPAFLYGWMRFWIASPGSIAAYAVGAATFIDTAILRSEGDLLPYWLGVGGRSGFALALVAFFTGLNCLHVMIGGRVQSILTALKVLLVVGLTLGILSSGGDTPAGPAGWSSSWTDASWPGFGAFGAALIAALWAYDGWNNLPMMAGEVRDAERNIPRALITGTFLIVVIYLAINFAYFYALPVEEVASANSRLHPDAPALAAKAASLWLGPIALGVLLGVFAFSSISGMHGSIMTNARVPYAMARDGLFFKELGKVHPLTQVPMVSILVQGFVSCILAASGTFDQLTDYVVFASWIFYALVIYSVFIFRKRDVVLSKKSKGSRVSLILPGGMLVASAWLFFNTLFQSPVESFVGLALICSGVPAYYWMKRRNQGP